MRYFLFLLASLGLSLVVAFFGAMRRPLARVLRAIMMAIVAILALAGTAIAVAGIEGDAWWAVIIGAGLGLIALRLGWGLRRPRPRGVEHAAHVPLTTTAAEPHWASFEARLDWVGRKQAQRARAAIDRFVAEKNSPSLTHEHRSLLLSCEKRVPELLDACLDRCRNASRHEQERYIDATLDRLVRIGREAEQARKEVREADDQRLQILHRYFEGVASADEGTRPR